MLLHNPNYVTILITKQPQGKGLEYRVAELFGGNLDGYLDHFGWSNEPPQRVRLSKGFCEYFWRRPSLTKKKAKRIAARLNAKYPQKRGFGHVRKKNPIQILDHSDLVFGTDL